MSISCPSLPLSLFEDIANLNEKYEENIKKVQTEIGVISSKLKDNSKEIEVIHKLFISLNDRINNTTKREIGIDSSSLREIGNNLELKIDKILLRIEEIEKNLNREIEKTKIDNREYIDMKMEEVHSRLLKNLGFLYEQQFRALRNEIFSIVKSPELIRPNPSIMVNPVSKTVEEPWTKVDKKNFKPK